MLRKIGTGKLIVLLIVVVVLRIVYEIIRYLSRKCSHKQCCSNESYQNLIFTIDFISFNFVTFLMISVKRAIIRIVQGVSV